MRDRDHAQITSIVSNLSHFLEIQNLSIKCEDTTTKALETIKDLLTFYENETHNGHLKAVLLVLLRFLVYKKNSIPSDTLAILNQTSES